MSAARAFRGASIASIVSLLSLAALAWPAGAHAAYDYTKGANGALSGTVTFGYSEPPEGSCPSVWWQPAPLEQSLRESATAELVANFAEGHYAGPVTITVEGTMQCFYGTEWVPSTISLSGTDRLGNTFACGGLRGIWFLFSAADYSVTAGGGSCSLNGAVLSGPRTSYYETGAFVKTESSESRPTSGQVSGAVFVSNY
ncbi:MAG: hypothetical protein ACRDL6_00685 [Solirubrobacterales bacterium]